MSRAAVLAAVVALCGCTKTPTMMCDSFILQNEWVLHKPTGTVGQVWWGDLGPMRIQFPGNKNSFATQCAELEVLL